MISIMMIAAFAVLTLLAGSAEGGPFGQGQGIGGQGFGGQGFGGQGQGFGGQGFGGLAPPHAPWENQQGADSKLLGPEDMPYPEDDADGSQPQSFQAMNPALMQASDMNDQSQFGGVQMDASMFKHFQQAGAQDTDGSNQGDGDYTGHDGMFDQDGHDMMDHDYSNDDGMPGANQGTFGAMDRLSALSDAGASMGQSGNNDWQSNDQNNNDDWQTNDQNNNYDEGRNENEAFGQDTMDQSVNGLYDSMTGNGDDQDGGQEYENDDYSDDDYSDDDYEEEEDYNCMTEDVPNKHCPKAYIYEEFNDDNLSDRVFQADKFEYCKDKCMKDGRCQHVFGFYKQSMFWCEFAACDTSKMVDHQIVHFAASKSVCRIHGGWGEFSDWVTCSVSCGGGITKRTRKCDSPAPAAGGEDCWGDAEETGDCSTEPCGVSLVATGTGDVDDTNVVNGNWGEWESYSSECPVSCGGGTYSKTRRCDSPAPLNGGADCVGDAQGDEACNTDPCPGQGNWGEWSSWNSCTQSCDGGNRQRQRYCDNPAPMYGGADCFGDDFDEDICGPEPCPVNGAWSLWSTWDGCSASCGGGEKERTRTCTSPAPTNGGHGCDGVHVENHMCNTQHCPVSGGWSPWSKWSDCSKVCAPGQKTKTRTCASPYPENGGADCVGEASVSIPCMFC